MSRLLSVVEAVFSIEGRGVVVLPGTPSNSDTPLRIGSTLVLKRPDGSETNAVIAAIETLRGSNPHPIRASRDRGILLGPEVRKDDVPVGTELYVS